MVGDEEKRDTGIRSITDYELRIAFDGIGSYDRTAQSFSNLAIRLTWQDSTAKLIGSYAGRTAAVDRKSRPYIIYSNCNTAESRFRT